ncbi:hypothetical protein IFM89_006547 [Coptis chinensis]|uniref:Homeobox domain-containing protein n=1 Tax=Coptis chinensis TaxID=261450 RepID=A0A835M4Y7_9MAGN|nr:hypothetical protein IFM89_006547 [Coptis chinensis]
MATYYSSLSNQRNVMPVISSRDPLHVPYVEGHVLPGTMMTYLNQPSSAASYSDSTPENFQLQLNCGEIPFRGGSHSTLPVRDNVPHLIGSHIEGVPYERWRDCRNEMSFMQPMSSSTDTPSIGKHVDSSITEDSQTGLSTQLETLYRGQNLQGEGLSLSLSTQIPTAIPVSLFQYQSLNFGLSFISNSYPYISRDGSNGVGSCQVDEISESGQPGKAGYLPPGFDVENHGLIKGESGLKGMVSNRLSGLSRIILNSKYLILAQQLLNEVVDVQKDSKQASDKLQSLGFGIKVSKDSDGDRKEGGMLLPTIRNLQNSEESKTPPSGSTSKSQDLQNKITEISSMLDEVDRKYKQYYHQMQIVASYFDGIAGSGASRPYTKLALQTISRRFRHVRDAMSGQIKAIRSTLGEEETAGNSKEIGISRLRFVEQKLRQHRALQQLGMMQQHAWRPQRGLPETSVSILRAWLFEHFLHPYPKETDKMVLARQTGLTRGQVSNWFINARVRLWKPMIEDIYKEEIGDSELNQKNSSDYAPKAASDGIKASKDMEEVLQHYGNSTTSEKRNSGQFHDSKSDLVYIVEMSEQASGDCFQDKGHGKTETDFGGMKLIEEQTSIMAGCSLPQDTPFQSSGSPDKSFASNAYKVAGLETLGSHGGVSLKLGLQHLDGTISDATRHKIPNDIYSAVASVEPHNVDIDCMDPDNQQYRFGNSYLLHDFVAY